MRKFLLLLTFVVISCAGVYIFAPGHLTRGFIAAERMLSGLATRQLHAGGIDFAYLDGGRGETILMLHGFGADKDNWVRFARHLTGRYRVIAPDLPGFGASSVPADLSFEVDAQVTRLIEFTSVLRLSRLHLVGNSMGGQIAAVLAARRPDLVASLALFDPAGVEQEPGATRSTMTRMLEQGENLLLPGNRQEFERMLSNTFYDPPWVPGAVINYYADKWISRQDLLSEVFADIRGKYRPLVPLLPDLQAPTLVLWGADDQILPVSGAHILAAGIRNSQLVIIPRCGHLPMLEKPRETAAHYLAFLSDLAQQ